jgi:hypothetical protein
MNEYVKLPMHNYMVYSRSRSIRLPYNLYLNSRKSKVREIETERKIIFTKNYAVVTIIAIVRTVKFPVRGFQHFSALGDL